jgi:hypothetical protein
MLCSSDAEAARVNARRLPRSPWTHHAGDCLPLGPSAPPDAIPERTRLDLFYGSSSSRGEGEREREREREYLLGACGREEQSKGWADADSRTG